MMRTARILLVEAEEPVRRDLDWHLERAGHEVASVPDAAAARQLIEDGLEPDLIVAHIEPAADTDAELRLLAPRALQLRMSPEVAVSPHTHDVTLDDSVCSRDPGEVIRRVEEVLFGSALRVIADEPSLCLDLVRRLSSALPRARGPEARVDLLVETFDGYFGVIGTFIVKRSASADQWVEAANRLEWSVARRIADEMARRAEHRGLRPFLTRLSVEGTSHEVAGFAVQVGEQITDLAMVLSKPPASPALRESLVSLVGSVLRTAMTLDELDSTRALFEAQGRSFSTLVETSRDLTRVGTRRRLCEEILLSLHRELPVTRSALFLARERGDSLLVPRAVSGFSELLLDRLGLSSYHGVGAMCLAASGVQKLSELMDDGVASRELRRLDEAGLRWAAALRIEDRSLGVLFFGNREHVGELELAEEQTLQVLLEAATVAVRNLERVEDLRDLTICALQGLVAAGEIRRPESRGRAERIARSALELSRAMNLTPPDRRDLVIAALLHDVGKLGSSGEAGTESEERRRERLHPVLGSRILSRAKPSAQVVQGVEQHHERYDGHGFPYGLRGPEISPFGRILAILEAFDRWTVDDEHPVEEALRRLELGAGLLFDPGLVAVFTGEVSRRPAAGPDVDADWLEDVVGSP